MGWVDSEIQTAAAPLVRGSEARNCAFLEVVGTREGGERGAQVVPLDSGTEARVRAEVESSG